MTKITASQITNNPWEEVGRATASGGANPAILTATFTAKKYLRVQVLQYSGGSNLESRLRFNSDSGANYDYRLQENTVADTPTNAATGISLGINSLEGMQGELYIVNVASKRKAPHGIFNYWGTGAGEIYRNIVAARWTNTTDLITSISMVAVAGSYKDGSEIIVMGKN